MTNFYRLFLFIFVTCFLACTSDSNEVDSIATDNTPPTLDLTFTGFPGASGSDPIVVSKQLEISVSAQDANGISKVEAFLNGDKVAEDLSAPFLIVIDVSQLESKSSVGKYKDYTLVIVATDKAGNTTSKEQVINVDNTLPVISEVSLVADTILNGTNNTVTFQVSDNEELASVGIYLNNELLSEVGNQGSYEANIDTSVLPEGPHTLKIEATDIAENKATFEVMFISDNQGPEISLQNLEDGQIIDQVTQLNPSVSDPYSDVASVEITFNSESLLVVESGTPVSYEFDPIAFTVGDGIFEITALDSLGNESTLAVSLMIHRRLIEINIPEGRISPYITAAVVFLSRMDGSNIVWKEILPEDRQIILSVPEAFDSTTEFMVSFYLQDNGGMASLTTHQNLTMGNPGVLNLAVPVRRDGEGLITQVPIANFLTNDVVIGESATSYSFLPSVDDTPSSYTVYLDTDQQILNVSLAEDPLNKDSFDQVYVFNLSTFDNLLIPNPVPANYVFDKANMNSDNLVASQLQVSSPNALSSTNSILRIFGSLSQEDDFADKFHEIFVWNRVGNLDSPMDYQLNSTFYSYRHALRFGKYYTERKGTPLATYKIPDLTVDYTFANNQIDLAIQGTEHSVGRAQCVDFDNLTYVWNVTFDSQKQNSAIVPDLPISISHPVKSVHQAGNIKVEKVELNFYSSIPSYDDYIDRVVRTQSSILSESDWYHLVYKSRTGDFNVPIRDFLFQ